VAAAPAERALRLVRCDRADSSRNTLSQSISSSGPPLRNQVLQTGTLRADARVGAGLPGPGSPNVGNLHLEEKMRKLVTLHQRGHISDGEFFVAKARLLQGQELPSLNPVASPGSMREELMDALGDTPPQSGVYRAVAGSDTPSLWGTEKGERFAEDLEPDAVVAVVRQPAAASAARAAAPREHTNGNHDEASVLRGDASSQEFFRFKQVHHRLEHTITDVPAPHPPPPEVRSPLPPPARASPQEQPSAARTPSAQPASALHARVIYPTRLGTVGSGTFHEHDEKKAKATAAALAEANRQVEEQKLLLQREQTKLLKVLNGPKLGGSAQSSPQGVATSAVPVEDRLRRFLTEERGNAVGSTETTSPREKGRVINLAQAQPPQTQSKDTQFVI
jgi:hypothetical protein